MRKGKIIIAIVIITVIQSFIFLNNKINKSIESQKNTTEVIKVDNITFKDIDSELSRIKEIEIDEINKSESGKWNSKIEIKGKLEEIKKVMETLENYEILDYYIECNSDKYNVFLEICR